jgi:hypothetical protein
MPQRPSAAAPVSVALERVLLVALAKAREARFATAAELAAAFVAPAGGTLSDDVLRRSRALACGPARIFRSSP